ncbi:ALQxL family class IV lanthipeptide [Kitasatospora sp. NPDC088346]
MTIDVEALQELEGEETTGPMLRTCEDTCTITHYRTTS